MWRPRWNSGMYSRWYFEVEVLWEFLVWLFVDITMKLFQALLVDLAGIPEETAWGMFDQILRKFSDETSTKITMELLEKKSEWNS